MFVQENICTKVIEKYEVAVCGGGIAGISAALASARQGKKTVLFEKEFILGGLGTAGLVTIYLPLCDGFGHQVSFGIAEELLRLSIKHGAEDIYPANWLENRGSRGENDRRFEAQYNPALFAVSAERLLRENGVDILYGTYAVGVKKNGEKIEYIITENKSGRRAYRIKAVVDATGDCDIAKFADAETVEFRQGNILAAWYYSLGNEGYKLNPCGACDVPDEEKDERDAVELLSNRRFLGLDGAELSEQVQMSHDAMYADFLKKRETDKSYVPTSIATIPQVRMTRHIAAEYELSHKEMHKRFEDSIGMVADWRKRGPVYEVPFGTLFSAKVKNLICAGRCTGVNETMWDIMRVIPCCAVTGQAAGVAAAMTDDFSVLDIHSLQNALRSGGVVIHEDEIEGLR